MKTIAELLLEIEKHPDWNNAKNLYGLSLLMQRHPEYFTHVLWNKQQIYEKILVDFDLDLNNENYESIKSLLDDEERWKIGDWIHNTIDYGFEYSEYEYSQEFAKRIERHGIINSILPIDDIFDGGIGNI